MQINTPIPYYIFPYKILDNYSDIFSDNQFIDSNVSVKLSYYLSFFTGASYSLPLNSGTDALIISILLLNLPPRSKIIVPNFTFAATANAVIAAGHVPVFCDVDKNTYNISEITLSDCLSQFPDARACIPVSLFGRHAPLNLMPLFSDIYFIYDNAQCFSNEMLLDKLFLSQNFVSTCVSFFPTKPYPAPGDAGAILFKNNYYYERAWSIARQGRSSFSKYSLSSSGFNSRINPFCAANLVNNYNNITTWQSMRSEIALSYFNFFSNHHFPHLKNFLSSFTPYTCSVFTLPLFSNKQERSDFICSIIDSFGYKVFYPFTMSHSFPSFPHSKNLSSSFFLSNSSISLPLYPCPSLLNYLPVIFDSITNFFSR